MYVSQLTLSRTNSGYSTHAVLLGSQQILDPGSFKRVTMPYRKGLLDRSQEQLIIWRMLVDICRHYHAAHFPNESFEARIGNLLVWMCVGIGHQNGHPLNASKVAEIMNMPRMTAVRKLDELCCRGILLKMGTHYILNEEKIGKATRHIPDIVRAIERAYHELSSLKNAQNGQ
jgi:hypothetical protein